MSDSAPRLKKRRSIHAGDTQKDIQQTADIDPVDLVLWKSPITTLCYAGCEACGLSISYSIKLLSNVLFIFTSVLLCLSYQFIYLKYLPDETTSSINSLVTRCIYWIILGVMSSVGLGTGLHTFLLYLGPHIAKVTMAAYECNSTDFDATASIISCPETASLTAVTLFTIMKKVRLEAFMWGAGTALGELPPYFMARAARLAGGKSDNDDFQNELDDALEEADTTTWLGKGKAFMHSLVQKVGFFGILLAASIPNPLFDLAGITCGHFLIPFWTFFGATLIGKAVVKMHIQMIFIIFIFSKHHVENLLQLLKHFPSVQKKCQNLFEKQVNVFSRKVGEDVEVSESGNILKSGFELFVMGMILYFVVSIVNSFAQNYAKKLNKKKSE